jgi:excisionase family DNA binding protein
MRRANTDAEFLTIRQAARRSGIGDRPLRRAAKTGEIPVYKRDGTWPRLRWTEVRAWIEGQRVPVARVTSHAEAVVERVLAREESRRAG